MVYAFSTHLISFVETTLKNAQYQKIGDLYIVIRIIFRTMEVLSMANTFLHFQMIKN